ncbi:bifunctional metallophosphatase/5'-nucleotidase [Draconibacterium halophilum]|uniref:Bifunctional metallophosphatase/5'-nucleotidase n=1 Tax=Draconibacterium halophilum TaxID=2706887 RepID=A0A6C0RE30_9BACT|nr:metallophosphatase [Draconibacterium halophilum]QIA08928.1 bifunctional metallophosphatase/5'-nucleotidase [Draconibacterium halophilum]
MDRRRFIRNVAAGTAGISLGAVPYELFAHEDFTTISILHTNDIHCHIEPFTGTNERYANKGGLARIARLADLQRQHNPNTLLLDAGDMFQGTPYFNYFKGELMLQVMSEAGYDASTIGNHEFDNGLQGIKDPLPNAEFPLITSNYDFSDTILAGSFPKFKIFKRSGIKIGLYGLGIELENLVGKVNYGETVYNDPLLVAREMESFLKNDKNCDLVICLSHLGLRYRHDKVSDMNLAAETSHTDLIIGGHTHSYLEKPLEEKNKLGQPVIVNQAWWGGLVVGKVDFVFEKSKRNKKAVYSDLL